MKNCNVNVLIADSDINFLTIAKNKLNSRGYEVRTSSSAKETIKILQEIGCDSILINISKEDERKILIDHLETLDNKPVILYGNISSRDQLSRIN